MTMNVYGDAHPLINKRKGVLRISEGQGEVRMRDIGSVPHNINTKKCLQIVNRSAGQPRTADSCLN